MAKNEFLGNASTDLKGTTFVIFINYASEPIKIERLNPTSKSERKASRNEFVEMGAMPDRVKSLREINNGEDRPRARPGIVKPIPNGLRKIKNLIYSRPPMAETGLVGKENGIRF